MDNEGKGQSNYYMQTFDGTENWSFSSDSEATVGFKVPYPDELKQAHPKDVKPHNYFYSHFKYIASGDRERFAFFIGVFWVSINKSRLSGTNVSDFKSWLAGQSSAGTPVSFLFKRIVDGPLPLTIPTCTPPCFTTG